MKILPGFLNDMRARGYITSGPFRGRRIPQNVQNIVIASYIRSIGFDFVLSRAEYYISDEQSRLQLHAMLSDTCEVFVFFSIWQLPVDRNARIRFFKQALFLSKSIHFASERVVISDTSDIASLELIMSLDASISNVYNQKEAKGLLLSYL